MIGQLCLNAHLPIRCQHMGICARSAHTNLRVSMSVPLSILYLLIINLMEFLKVWAKHNFYYIRYISVYIQPRYFYLIFRSVNGDSMNRVILWGHHSERSGLFPTDLDAAVQRVAVKSLPLVGNISWSGGRWPVSEVEIETLVTRVNDVYGTGHYEEPLKLFDKTRA